MVETKPKRVPGKLFPDSLRDLSSLSRPLWVRSRLSSRAPTRWRSRCFPRRFRKTGGGRAGFAASETIGAQRRQTTGDPRRDLVRHDFHEIGDGDERALFFFKQRLQIALLRLIGRVEHV